MTYLDRLEERPWRHIADLVVGGGMLALAFVGIAASDVSGASSQTYWTILAIVFGLAAFGLLWLHAGADFPRSRQAVVMAVHWLGVLAAVELVYLFIAAGRLTNADTGLLNGVVLALGTFLAGVHGGAWAGWRLVVIGAAIGLATAAVAYLEQYLWVLLGLALLALAAVFFVGRLRARA
jgi:hypothetical protein